jgi:ABC-type branched-subunit amino acid transport system ATPase component
MSLAGSGLASRSARRSSAAGIGFVPENRRIFAELSVQFLPALADLVYVLERRAIRFSGPAARLRDDEALCHKRLAI